MLYRLASPYSAQKVAASAGAAIGAAACCARARQAPQQQHAAPQRGARRAGSGRHSGAGAARARGSHAGVSLRRVVQPRAPLLRASVRGAAHRVESSRAAPEPWEAPFRARPCAACAAGCGRAAAAAARASRRKAVRTAHATPRFAAPLSRRCCLPPCPDRRTRDPTGTQASTPARCPYRRASAAHSTHSGVEEAARGIAPFSHFFFPGPLCCATIDPGFGARAASCRISFPPHDAVRSADCACARARGGGGGRDSTRTLARRRERC
jgi:hypothetical protein